MGTLIRDLDRLLRGEFSGAEVEQGRVPLGSLLRGALLLGVLYGLFMGVYAAMRGESASAMQLLASAVKVPLLFLLTLVVTFPSLYVFSALAQSPLRGGDTLRLLLASITVNMALLASFGPVTGFFTLSTDSYPFMVLLNVAFFAIGGLAGLSYLRRALRGVFLASLPEPDPVPPPLPVPEAGAVEQDGATSLPPAPRPHRAPRPAPSSPFRIFRVWLLVYGVVGAQMGWILRPFIGSPGQDFSWFRARESHFFEAVAQTISRLFS